jgi:hypothetical protein
MWSGRGSTTAHKALVIKGFCSDLLSTCPQNYPWNFWMQVAVLGHHQHSRLGWKIRINGATTVENVEALTDQFKAQRGGTPSLPISDARRTYARAC